MHVTRKPGDEVDVCIYTSKWANRHILAGDIRAVGAGPAGAAAAGPKFGTPTKKMTPGARGK